VRLWVHAFIGWRVVRRCGAAHPGAREGASTGGAWLQLCSPRTKLRAWHPLAAARWENQAQQRASKPDSPIALPESAPYVIVRTKRFGSPERYCVPNNHIYGTSVQRLNRVPSTRFRLGTQECASRNPSPARSAAVPGIPFRREKVPGFRTGRSSKESGSAARLWARFSHRVWPRVPLPRVVGPERSCGAGTRIPPTTTGTARPFEARSACPQRASDLVLRSVGGRGSHPSH